MTEPKALVVRQEPPLSEMMLQAKYLVDSGFMPKAIRKPEQALAIILMGKELQLGPIAAINNINVIDGKPTASAQLMLALVRRSGEAEIIDVQPEAENNAACVVTMQRRGSPPFTTRFTDTDAERLGLLIKDNWKKQKTVMRMWRCIAAAIRVVFPDVVLGLYTPDEMGSSALAPAVPFTIVDDETGEVLEDNTTLEGEYRETTPATDNSFDDLFKDL